MIFKSLIRRKKILYVFSMACLVGVFVTGFAQDSQPCAFCDREVLLRQKFYEDELVLVLYTHKPIFPGHCLIIPKRHVERFEMLSDDEIDQMGRVTKKVHQAVMQVFKTRSYLLL